MFRALEPGNPHIPFPRPQELTYHLGIAIFQRTPKEDIRLRGQQLFEMRSFCTRAVEECLWSDHLEGLWVLEDCYAEGGEEGFVEGVEDGVLGVDLWFGLGI